MAAVAIETSARPPSIASRAGGRTEEVRLDQGRRHASDLLSSLSALLTGLGAEPASIETLVVGTGPGSYTGLRVGIATALGLARATGAALVAVPSVESLAFAALSPGEEGVVLLDARSQALYLAHYRRLEDGIETLVAPRIVRAVERAALEELLAGGVTILGDDSVANAAGLAEEQCARLRTDRVPSAAALLTLGLRRLEREGATPAEEVQPLYLRPFEARVRRR